LAQLPGEAKIFTAQDGGIEPFLKELQNNCPAPGVLELKLNAQVLLVKNIDAKLGLVNGSRGVVTCIFN
jgi:ATP-dependent DNA helicase PIF1